jgi:group I intron endonuclease
MIVYKATNKTNGKVYIGKTLFPLSIRISQHKAETKAGRIGSLFHKAIEEFGIEYFEFEVLHYCFSNSEAEEKEKELIKLFDSRNPDKGYNLTVGGKGTGSGEESIKFGSKRKIESKFKQSKTIRSKFIFHFKHEIHGELNLTKPKRGLYWKKKISSRLVNY